MLQESYYPRNMLLLLLLPNALTSLGLSYAMLLYI